MSCDLERGLHSPCEVRGHFSRSALPCLRLSALDVLVLDSIPDSPDPGDSPLRYKRFPVARFRQMSFTSRSMWRQNLCNPLHR